MEKQGDQTDVSSTGQRRRTGRRGGSAARRSAGRKRAGSGGVLEGKKKPGTVLSCIPTACQGTVGKSGAPGGGRGRWETRKALRQDHSCLTGVRSTGLKGRRSAEMNEDTDNRAGGADCPSCFFMLMRRSQRRFRQPSAAGRVNSPAGICPEAGLP